MLLENRWTGGRSIRTRVAAGLAAPTVYCGAGVVSIAGLCRRCHILLLKGDCIFMKIVVIKSPKLLSGILRGIFGIKKTTAA